MKIPAIASAALAALVIAGTAQAQPAQPSNPGPVIPGVCTYNNQRALVTSMVGQAVAARLEQLNAAVQAELQPEAQAIETEATTLSGQQGTLAADAFQQRAGALQQRAQAFERLAQTRAAELQYTEQQQIAQIAQRLDPILVQVYQERGCGLLLDRAAMFGANPAMDVTDRVIELLNGQLQTLTFDRMSLPQQ